MGSVLRLSRWAYDGKHQKKKSISRFAVDISFRAPAPGDQRVFASLFAVCSLRFAYRSRAVPRTRRRQIVMSLDASAASNPLTVPLAGARIGRKVLLGVLSRGHEIESGGRYGNGRAIRVKSGLGRGLAMVGNAVRWAVSDSDGGWHEWQLGYRAKRQRCRATNFCWPSA